MAIVYLAIGSNLGDRAENIKLAKTHLATNNINILQCSSIIETAPQGGPPNQCHFLNGVLKVETGLLPRELLALLKTIESKLGRIETVRNGPRPIDLDILLYDQLKLQTPQLTIPHPRMLERDFVMNPLNEIDPQLTRELTHARH
jgi:2-amino-4-hydroxy-6-hydroxymethyldihydropteridine diphosphokinase